MALTQDEWIASGLDNAELAEITEENDLQESPPSVAGERALLFHPREGRTVTWPAKRGLTERHCCCNKACKNLEIMFHPVTLIRSYDVPTLSSSCC